MVRSEARHALLRAQGARIGHLTVVGRLRISGSLALLTVGDHCAIGDVELTLHAPLTIGKNVVINDGCKIMTATHNTSSVWWETQRKPVVVSDYAWIASSAILLPGVTIGQGAVVGAGSVVARDVPEYSVAIGNRATLMRTLRPIALAYDPIRSIAFVSAWLESPNR